MGNKSPKQEIQKQNQPINPELPSEIPISEFSQEEPLTLKQKFKLQFQNQKQIIPEEIFKFLISKEKEDLQSLFQLRSKKKTVCGGRIEQSDLCFQCFTCAPDPHHVFCASCFVREKHQNHHCTMRYEISGCCDCGDNKTVIESAFCDDHCGIKKNAIIEGEIPTSLKQQVSHFIQIGFFNYFKNIEKCNHFTFQELIVCDILFLKEKGLSALNESMSKYENIFKGIEKKLKRFRKALFYHNLLFEVIKWFCDSNMPGIMLITDLLLQPADDIVRQQIKIFHDCNTGEIKLDEQGKFCTCFFLQNIVRNATYLEYGPMKPKQTDDVFYIFHANDTFKKVLLETLMKEYSHLQRRTVCEYTNFEIQLKKELGQLNNASSQQLSQIKPEDHHMRMIIQVIDQVFQQQGGKIQKLMIHKPEIHSHHTQYVSVEYQRQFFQQQTLHNIFENIQSLFELSTQIEFENQSLINSSSYIFKLRLDYSFHGQLSLEIIKKLKPNFTEADFEDASFVELFLREHFIPRLMDCYATQQPLKPDAQLWQNNDEKNNYFLNHIYAIGNQISIVLASFKKLMEERISLTLPLTKILLQHAFQLLTIRNKFPTFYNSKITDDCYLASINCDLLMPRQTLADNLLINASICDKFFSYFLNFLYFQESNLKLESLLGVIHTNHQTFTENIQNSVSRALQSFHFCLQDSSSLNTIYQGQIYQTDFNCISGDLSLIKIYIYLYGNQGIDFILEESEKQSFKPFMMTLRLFLTILTSDLDQLNFSSNYNQLEENSKTYLRKLLLSIFIINNYFSFDELKQLLIQIGVLKSLPLEKYVLEICELDPFLKKLKLKPEFYNQKIYEPCLFERANSVKSKIVEKLIEIQEIDQNIGNALFYEFKQNSQLIGPLRLEIFKICSNNQQFQNFLATKLTKITQKEFLLHSKLILLFYSYATSIELKQQLQNSFEQIKTNFLQTKENPQGQEDDISQFHCQVDQLFNKVQIKMEVENISTEKKENKISQMKLKFLEKQAQFQKQVQDVIEETVEVCLSCKLPLLDDIALPALISMANNHKYLPMYKYDSSFLNLHLHTCFHVFHFECLRKLIKKLALQLPAWCTQFCPVCKCGMNCILDKKNYRDTIIQVLNTDDYASEFYYSKYQPEEEDLMFLDSQLSIIAFQLIEKQNYQIICDFIRYSFINLDPIKAQMLQDRVKVLEGKLNKDNIIEKNLAIILQSFFGNEVNIQDSINSIEVQPSDLMMQACIEKLGETFNDFYQKYFLKGCHTCKYYPKRLRGNLYLCLLCGFVTCPFTCSNKDFDQREFGNLNEHSRSTHYGSSVYVSILFGDVVLNYSPVTILHYRQLYFNKIGQIFDYHQYNAIWNEYILDKRIVIQICQLLMKQKMPHVIRSLEIRQAQREVNGKI